MPPAPLLKATSCGSSAFPPSPMTRKNSVKSLSEIFLLPATFKLLLRKWRRWRGRILLARLRPPKRKIKHGPLSKRWRRSLRPSNYSIRVGVAARTPQECLLIQIKALGYDRDQVLVDLVRDHLEDLEAHRYKPLLRKFRLDMDELKEYLDIIQSLDPMPGASFGEGVSTFVSPDVFVYKVDGEFLIVLNEDGLPNLHLSPVYDNASENASSKEKEYFNEKIRSAAWLIKSLHQRQRTLYKVVESIVKHQRGFFEEGISKFKPLILKDIADDINMHESTVSRITTNKYVATPFGVYELKFFFNSALELDDGSQVGSESVKALIKKCISEEDPKNPLSDERIGEILKEHLKVNIARRTVAKYRMAMDIPSSSRRKAHF